MMKKETISFIFVLGFLLLLGFAARVIIYFTLEVKHSMEYLLESAICFLLPAVLFSVLAFWLKKRMKHGTDCF